MAPLVILLAVGAVLLHRRRASNPDAASAAAAGGSGSGSSSSADDVTWRQEWGTPNEWDARYPSSDPSRPITYDPSHLDSTFRTKLDAAFAAMRAQGYDPKVYEGARTQRRQAWLYGQGRTTFPVYGRTGNQVTWTLQASNHGTYPARSVDVISTSKGWGDMSFFDALGVAVKAQGLNWGGDWRVRDYPHVEVEPWTG